jgi:MSHA biogenesis protein MshM
MYQEHFGLRELPFGLTPDTLFLYEWAGHREALNTLLVALRSGEGFVKIVGEVGTGKTLLCRKLLAELGEEFVTAYIPNPSLRPTGLRLAVAEELGLDIPTEINSHHLLKRIAERLIELHAAGKRVVLLLDEAQALPAESLDALRLLTNLETETTKLLQVVLFGQPELDEVLARSSLRQLRQRITFSHRLVPIGRERFEGYLSYRLAIAGSERDDLFTPGAVNALYRASGGIPRLINVLGHKSLMAAFGCGDPCVDRGHVRRAVLDTEGAMQPRWVRLTRRLGRRTQ